MTPNAETATNVADLLASMSLTEATRGLRLILDLIVKHMQEHHGQSLDEAMAFADAFAELVVAELNDNRRATRH